MKPHAAVDGHIFFGNRFDLVIGVGGVVDGAEGRITVVGMIVVVIIVIMIICRLCLHWRSVLC